MTNTDPLAMFASTSGTAPTPAQLGPGAITPEHKVLVGVMLMVILLILLTEVAGVSSQWAEGVGLLLLGPLLILGFNNSAKFASWVGNNPIQ